jgi:hypothetical protein
MRRIWESNLTCFRALPGAIGKARPQPKTDPGDRQLSFVHIISHGMWIKTTKFINSK